MISYIRAFPGGVPQSAAGSSADAEGSPLLPSATTPEDAA